MHLTIYIIEKRLREIKIDAFLIGRMTIIKILWIRIPTWKFHVVR